MSRVFILGGLQRDRTLDEWHQYKKGLLIRVDLESGEAERCVEYVSPPEACADEEPSVLFKAGTLEDGRLYVCTSTEVLVYDAADFSRVAYVSLPAFNDLHHVRPTAGGSMLIANTGLDMVMEVTVDGEVLRAWDVLGQPLWSRFSPEVDYRKIATTKPHHAHPNYVFQIDEQVWVTRLEQKDAACLTEPGRRIAIDVQRPHDGIVRGQHVHFTTVDGHVVVAHAQTAEVVAVHDLNAMDGKKAQTLGWCRGLLPLDERFMWVGFTRVRPTKFRENLSFIKHGFGRVHRPTRIALFDLVAGECLKEIDLEPFGVNAIFSILAEPGS